MTFSGPAVPTVGMLLRAYREAKGMSARELSVSAGLSASYCGKVEAGTMAPSFRAMAKIMYRLGMTNGEIGVLIVLEAGERNG